MGQGVLESRRTLAIYIAAGASFAALAARGLTVPLYAHDLGADRFQVGALFSVATLAGAALSLPSGLLIDRFGPRALLAFSLVVAAGSQIAAAATTTVFPLFVWQIVGGLGAGAQQAALFSAVTESVKSGRLGRAMGWLTMSMQVGFFVGPSIAGLLLTWLDIRTDLAVTTAMLVFAVPGALLASGTRQSVQRGLSLREPLRALVAQAAFVPMTIGLVAATLVWGTVGAFLPIFGKEALHLPGSQVGLLLALQAVANGLSRIPGGRLVDRARKYGYTQLADAVEKAWDETAKAIGVQEDYEGTWRDDFFVPLRQTLDNMIEESQPSAHKPEDVNVSESASSFTAVQLCNLAWTKFEAAAGTYRYSYQISDS